MSIQPHFAECVDTQVAQVLVGRRGAAFRVWALRRGLRPVRPGGGRGHLALWDLEQLHAALDRDGTTR